MNETKAGAIFIEYCTQPDFDRVDFLIRMETESKTSPQSFARYMMAAWQFYHDKLNYKIQESRGWGNDIKDYGIPLLIESGGRFEGDLFFSQLPELLDGIKQYINKRCHLLPIITDGKTYHYYFDQSEIPENIIGDYKKWFDARPKFQLTDAALKQWQTDYNFFLSTRPNLRALLLAKGIEYAEILLNHCKEHEPADLHQIDSLERRIIAAKRMAAIEATPVSNKAAKPPSLKSTKRELNELTTIAIALIHVFTKNPITTENRKDIAARYINPASGKPYSAIKLYTSYMNLPMERLRQKPTETLCNHYKRCINWLKSNGLKPAQRAAESELRQLKKKKVND